MSLRLWWMVLVVGVSGPGCAYFNTLHNAKAKFAEAQEIKEKSDPERTNISNQEKNLYQESFEKAAKVVKYYPDSKWVDDALLLMGKAAFERGDFSTALRKFEEILTYYPDSDLVPQALLMKGRTHIETKEYAEAVDALTRAADLDKKETRDGVIYFSGVVQSALGNQDNALVSFGEVLNHHKGSEWYAEAGIAAGAIAEEQGHPSAAADFYHQVRRHGRTPQDRFRGGMQKGRALLSVGEYERAIGTFRDVAGASTNNEDEGEARLAEGDVYVSLGEIDRARELFLAIIEKMPLSEPAANAQFAIARTWDDAGDLERANQEYELVREQGSGFEAWQIASRRMAEIQSVIDLRLAIEKDDDDDRERKRYLLAEQLLEEIGNVDAALAEYSSLATDAFGTEWGAKALYAEAWVLENRLDEPDSAEVLLHRLANYHTGTEADAYARRRLGYPVWTVEKVDAPPVKFIRSDMDTEPEEIVLSRVDPRDVPLPPGVSEVEVWIRLTIGDDGSIEKTKIVKSGGDAFDAAVIEAVEASRFLSPSAGGPRITVARYVFPPPRREEAPPSEVPAETPLPPSTIAGSVPGLEASIPDSLVTPDSFLSTPDDTTVTESPERIENPTLRGKRFDPSAPD